MNIAPNPSLPTLPPSSPRRGFIRRHRGKLCLLGFVLVIFGVYTALNCPVPFNSATWKADGEEPQPHISGWYQFGLRTHIRIRMLPDLLRSYNLSKMTHSEIVALLGTVSASANYESSPPNAVIVFTDDPTTAKPINQYFQYVPPMPGDSAIAYNLGQKATVDGFFWEQLQIVFAPDGRVRKISVYDDGS